MSNTPRLFAAEFLGTFLLVFVGSGAIMMTARSGGSQSGLLAVAIAHGLALGVAVSATMHISGFCNPAITIGLLIGRRVGVVKAAVSIVAQLAGAAAAAYILKTTFPLDLVSASRVGGQSIALDITTGRAILLEAVATFFLMFAVYGTAVHEERPNIGGLAVGFTLSAMILAIGPLTGASLNPARSFGPALASGVWEGQLVYWIGPIVGAVVCALLWEYVIGRRSKGSPAS